MLSPRHGATWSIQDHLGAVVLLLGHVIPTQLQRGSGLFESLREAIELTSIRAESCQLTPPSGLSAAHLTLLLGFTGALSTGIAEHLDKSGELGAIGGFPFIAESICVGSLPPRIRDLAANGCDRLADLLGFFANSRASASNASTSATGCAITHPFSRRATSVARLAQTPGLLDSFVSYTTERSRRTIACVAQYPKGCNTRTVVCVISNECTAARPYGIPSPRLWICSRRGWVRGGWFV